MSFFRKVSDSESESDESEEELMSDYEKEEGEKKTTSAGATGTTSTGRKSAFLKGGDSDSDDSDSDDDDDSDDSDDDDEESDDDEEGDGPSKRKQSRFLRGASDDSDSEEEVKKVVKSARDKRVDEMDAIIKSIENAQRIDDWVAISKEFDSLTRLSDRIKMVNEPTPPSFYKVLVTLEEFLQQSIGGEKKKMKAPNVRAMNAMRLKLKKILKDNEEVLTSYRNDPEAFEASYAAATAPAQGAAQPKKAKKSVASGVAGEEGEDDDEFQTVGRGGKAVTYTSEGLFKSLAAVMEARGKKATDRSEQIDILTKLFGVAASTYQKVRVLLALLAARFDYNQSAAAYMNLEMWNSARLEVEQLLQILTEDRSYQVKEVTGDYDDEIDRQPNENGEGPVVEVRGSVVSFIERLDDEFTKSLQHIDPHTTEYVDRLRDEKLLYHTIIASQVYFQTVDQNDALSRITMRRLDHIYAKPDNIIQALETASRTAPGAASVVESKATAHPSVEEVTGDKEGASRLIRALCIDLYKTVGIETERLRTRAMLCHIYHHALRRDYQVARDMFLMSHLQDTIGMADAATQILYNRVVVQLGVCAFRVGLIREAQGALQEIFASTRVKELLAQGVSRTNPYVSPEQEKLDRQRQLPFHMHINLELLECIYLVSSMLLEVPNMAHATSEADLRKNVISRTFRKMLDFTDRQVFSGPAESTRDHVMAAAKALQNGNWKESQDQIAEIKIWNLMSDHKEVIAMLKGKIQEEGLRTYLFTYSHYYKSLSLRHLADMFELPLSQVKSIVSVMVWNEDLQASLDMGGSSGSSTENAGEKEDGFVVLHGVQLSKVQQLSQQLAEKANALLEQNERTLDAKLGDRAGPGGEGRAGGQDRDGRDGRDGGAGGRREGRRGGASGRGGRGRGRGRAQFNALPGQQTV